MENNKHYGVLFNRNSGKIIKTLVDNNGSAFLKFYAMGNVSPSRDFVVFSAESGEIKGYYEGKKNDMPNICKDMEGKNINDICEGLLEALNG